MTRSDEAQGSVFAGIDLPDLPGLPDGSGPAGIAGLKGEAADSHAQKLHNWRGQVRKALLKARREMPASVRVPAEAKICQLLAGILSSDAVLERGCVGFYWPVQGEIDVRDVIAHHIAWGGAGALPVVTARDQPMVFHHWTPHTQMVSGFAGIDIPAEPRPVVPDIVLAPLVGFDRQGYRLGYGGGFFDRTLAALDFKPVVVGIGFAHAQLDNIFPHQFDVPMDILVTEAGVTRFERSAG